MLYYERCLGGIGPIFLHQAGQVPAFIIGKLVCIGIYASARIDVLRYHSFYRPPFIARAFPFTFGSLERLISECLEGIHPTAEFIYGQANYGSMPCLYPIC